MKNPCKDCPNIQLDDYGYLCDLACGQKTAYLNHQKGMKEVVKWVSPHLQNMGGRDNYPPHMWIMISERDWKDYLKDLGL